MPRVVHFELDAHDPERATSFYSKVFGWKAKKWEGPQDYWMITTGADGQPGINGGLTKQMGAQPCIAIIDVPSVDEYTTRITKNGGRIVKPKMAVPGVGYLAYGTDSEGTIIGIMQFDKAAR
jgi:predicted enzyme related to lactoylglutathione lyase